MQSLAVRRKVTVGGINRGGEHRDRGALEEGSGSASVATVTGYGHRPASCLEHEICGSFHVQYMAVRSAPPA